MDYENGPEQEMKYGYSRDDDHRYEYPYQQYYGDGGDNGGRKRGGGHGGWWIALAAVVLIVGVGVFLSRYSVDMRQTKDGIVVSVKDNTDSKAPKDTTPPAAPGEDNTAAMLPAPSGSGAKLTVSAAVPTGVLSVDGKELTLQKIYKKVIPSVASITTQLANGSATGTGIMMSEDGYIITNNHVIEGAYAVQVLLSDDRTFDAVLVGSDESSDLAVLKIEATDLTPAEFGDADQMEVGDAVVAIGDPLGTQLRGTMTDGIISAINRDLTVNGRKMTLMQTNAALNNGNSGGPLINSYGQVIGVNTMKMSSIYLSASVEGLGFAIPISTAKPIIDELIEKGFVSGRPAIGITGDALPKSAQAYYSLPSGVYVNSVEPTSSAYEQGIEPGDIITAINDVQVTTMDGLNSVKNQYMAGDTVTLTVFRGGKSYNVQVVLMDRAET